MHLFETDEHSICVLVFLWLTESHDSITTKRIHGEVYKIDYKYIMGNISASFSLCTVTTECT